MLLFSSIPSLRFEVDLALKETDNASDNAESLARWNKRELLRGDRRSGIGDNGGRQFIAGFSAEKMAKLVLMAACIA